MSQYFMNDEETAELKAPRFPDLSSLANSVGELSYDSLSAFLGSLAVSVRIESVKETASGGLKNSERLRRCHEGIKRAEDEICSAWTICRPHMVWTPGSPRHGCEIPEIGIGIVDLGRRVGSMGGNSLETFLGNLSEKFARDSRADGTRGRPKLANHLANASAALAEARSALNGT